MQIADASVNASYVGLTGAERVANARLIAAAPELLGLARRVAARFANTDPSLFDNSDAALGLAAEFVIAKAEGR